MSNELVLSDVMDVGGALAKSGYFVDAKDASQAVVKVLAGQELGIGPVAAMTGLYIVKGKVTLSANVMAGLIKSSQKYNYKISEHTSEVCAIEFFEAGASVGISEFTIDDAKRAGLLNQDPWKKYPKNMLFSRALSNGAKWFCPDIMNGQSVYTPEEIEEREPEIIIEAPAQSLKQHLDKLSPAKKLEYVTSRASELGYTGDSTIPAVMAWINTL